MKISNFVFLHPSTGTFSCLNATFLLHRRIHFHLIQTYFPTCLAVFISWVAFYIKPELPQIRVALGCATLFAVLSIASSIRSAMPRVTYVKAIDVWITACIIIIFAELTQTVLVNYLIRMRLRPSIMRRVDFGIANLIHVSSRSFLSHFTFLESALFDNRSLLKKLW